MWIDDAGDPVAEARDASAGQLMTLEFVSRENTLAWSPPALIVQLFPTAQPIGGTPGYSGVQIDFSWPFAVIYGSLFPLPLPNPGLPVGGIQGAAVIPPGLSGTTLRMQGFVFTSQTPSGFASTDALELRLQ